MGLVQICGMRGPVSQSVSQSVHIHMLPSLALSSFLAWKSVPGTQCSSAKQATEAAVRLRPMAQAVMERSAACVRRSV